MKRKNKFDMVWHQTALSSIHEKQASRKPKIRRWIGCYSTEWCDDRESIRLAPASWKDWFWGINTIKHKSISSHCCWLKMLHLSILWPNLWSRWTLFRMWTKFNTLVISNNRYRTTFELLTGSSRWVMQWKSMFELSQSKRIMSSITTFFIWVVQWFSAARRRLWCVRDVLNNLSKAEMKLSVHKQCSTARAQLLDAVEILAP